MKEILVTVLMAILGGSVEGLVGWGLQAWSSDAKLANQAAKAAEGVEAEVEEAPPTPPIPTPPTDDPNWNGQEVGAFGIFVLSQEYRWKLGSVQVVAPGGENVDMEEKLKRLLFQYGMQYGDLIAVGTASCEGDPHREAGRASVRSQELISWLRPVLGELEKERHRQLYRLDMGQFRDCRGLDSEQTGEQRRVILLAAKSRSHQEKDALERDLCATLKERKPLGFDPEDYSQCALQEAR